ncbi:hypothetical protein L917_19450 [Phytophthora nicotianae]|uniref:Uncharacterized protein n=3 Tax=Phytophthora nicotianae TaxID=4792 RepID=W2PJF0_PHYN3|nr:hypothetical protein PPTG_24285 [Phytophthora nicotianae INRA-310]ETL80022.1 hypothetical protein L917_19450 [Phytophthora nicotianae]ETN00349.1 hypothetical protein PPTG_24285 [Phytophthora nicotianae INRA-310]ETO61761.1 hypothetical protein F444_20279 [Phytophthora nicotianae P1976]
MRRKYLAGRFRVGHKTISSTMEPTNSVRINQLEMPLQQPDLMLAIVLLFHIATLRQLFRQCYPEHQCSLTIAACSEYVPETINHTKHFIHFLFLQRSSFCDVLPEYVPSARAS